MMSVFVNQLHHLINGFTKLRIHLGLVVAMNAAAHDFRAAPDEAIVFRAPLHKLGVAGGLCFDFFACHNSTFFHRFQRAPHILFLIVLGVVAGITAHQHPQSFRMNKIPMAALAATVHKPDFFQVGN